VAVGRAPKGAQAVGWRKPERKERVLSAEMLSACAAPAARWRLRPVVVLLLCLAVSAAPLERARAAGSDSQNPPAYRFGVFPYLPALTIDRIFGPIAASFAAELGRPVYLKTRSSFEQFAEQLENEAYEIIFVHPFFYVQAADRYDYLPLARLEGQLTAIVLVREERPWRSWSDLAGKIVATPPALAAVSELARLALVDAGLVPGVDTTLRHYQTKVSCLQAVSIGAADACVLPSFVMPQLDAVGEVKLRTMAETPAINNLVIATHRRVAGIDQRTLLALILSWPENEQGRAILAAGPWPRFVAAHDADYAQVRKYEARMRMLAHR
jgi:ABC-type phosphate/phosphonate transport system substrate-binding protein